MAGSGSYGSNPETEKKGGARLRLMMAMVGEGEASSGSSGGGSRRRRRASPALEAMPVR